MKTKKQKGSSLSKRSLEKLLANKKTLVGLIMILAVCSVCFTAPLFINYDPLAVDISLKRAEPSAEHPLGCDANVCDHIGITKIYFGRLFQKEEGISFGTYINQCRIEQAKSILEKTNMRVSEVAGAVGFSNTKYFSVVFKSTTGMTPLDCRRSKR